MFLLALLFMEEEIASRKRKRAKKDRRGSVLSIFPDKGMPHFQRRIQSSQRICF